MLPNKKDCNPSNYRARMCQFCKLQLPPLKHQLKASADSQRVRHFQTFHALYRCFAAPSVTNGSLFWTFGTPVTWEVSSRCRGISSEFCFFKLHLDNCSLSRNWWPHAGCLLFFPSVIRWICPQGYLQFLGIHISMDIKGLVLQWGPWDRIL